MSKLKQLQNNFTTVEQSRRLLELGVPADSADCYWRNYGDNENRADVRFVLNGYDKIHTIKKCYEPDTEITPCWSVGRLIEIAWICHNSYGFFMTMCTSISRIFKAEQSIIEIMIDCLFDNTIDFSKLED